MSAIEPTDRHGAQWTMHRWRIGAGVFTVYLAYTVIDLWHKHYSGATQAVGLALIGIFLGLYLWLLPRAMFGHGTSTDGTPLGYVVIGSMATVLVLYLTLVGGGGLVFAVYLAVAVVPLLPPRVSLPVVAVLAVGVTYLPQYVHSWDMHGLQWSIGGPILLAAAAMYGFRRNSWTENELVLAREEVATLATEQERLRIARDLHDLLGHALTTVIVKAELASRLAGRGEHERAAAEMKEVAELGRQGLADVRATVAGYREVSLATELATAREVLHAAGISAELPAAVEGVPPELRELFGWAVREGVTNVVRHSRARRVVVKLSDRAIEVVDDGVGEDGPAGMVAGGGPGNGLAGLVERAGLLGGRVQAGPAGPAGTGGTAGTAGPAGARAGAGRVDGFRLRVEVPA